MRALQVTAFDRPPELAEVADPRPDAGEALIRVRACGLNFADLLMAEGRYQETPALPFTLGLEIAGEVVELGPDTDGPAPGTRVAVYCGQGGLADLAVVPVALCRGFPPSLPDPEAAALQIAYGTSHLALVRRARLRAGETLVILGAAGGVGLAAVEVGAALGARVVAVARGAEKRALAAAAGADIVVDAEADLRAELTALGGVDVLYDPVGGTPHRAVMGAMRPEGRVLLIGFASGTVPEVRANHLLVKNVDLIGFVWGAYQRFAPDVLAGSLDVLFGVACRGADPAPCQRDPAARQGARGARPAARPDRDWQDRRLSLILRQRGHAARSSRRLAATGRRAPRSPPPSARSGRRD